MRWLACTSTVRTSRVSRSWHRKTPVWRHRAWRRGLGKKPGPKCARRTLRGPCSPYKRGVLVRTQLRPPGQRLSRTSRQIGGEPNGDRHRHEPLPTAGHLASWARLALGISEQVGRKARAWPGTALPRPPRRQTRHRLRCPARQRPGHTDPEPASSPRACRARRNTSASLARSRRPLSGIDLGRLHRNRAVHQPRQDSCNRRLLRTVTASRVRSSRPAQPPEARIYARGHVGTSLDVTRRLTACRRCGSIVVTSENARFLHLSPELPV